MEETIKVKNISDIDNCRIYFPDFYKGADEKRLIGDLASAAKKSNLDALISNRYPNPDKYDFWSCLLQTLTIKKPKEGILSLSRIIMQITFPKDLSYEYVKASLGRGYGGDISERINPSFESIANINDKYIRKFVANFYEIISSRR